MPVLLISLVISLGAQAVTKHAQSPLNTSNDIVSAVESLQQNSLRKLGDLLFHERASQITSVLDADFVSTLSDDVGHAISSTVRASADQLRKGNSGDECSMFDISVDLQGVKDIIGEISACLVNKTCTSEQWQGIRLRYFQNYTSLIDSVDQC